MTPASWGVRRRSFGYSIVFPLQTKTPRKSKDLQGDVIFIVFTLDICRGFASNKIGMFLLQILDKTYGKTAEATAVVVVLVRFVREEV
jgi:hypothetical protein